MYRLLVRAMIRRSIRRHQAGDVEGVLGAYADDVRFVFPGRNSWAGELRGKKDIAQWLRRFHRARLTVQAHEILVGGWPWQTTVCVRFTDHATEPNGSVVYANRGVIFAKVAWGKITFYEVYEDTEKLAEFDKFLASHEGLGS